MHGVFGGSPHQRTGRQGNSFRTPYNVSQQQTGGMYGDQGNRPSTTTSSVIGGMQTMARPEGSWSIGHQENQAQQQRQDYRSRSVPPSRNYGNQAQMNYYPPQYQAQQPQQQNVAYQRQAQPQQQQQQPAATTVYAGNVFGNAPGGGAKPTMGVPPELEGNPNVNYVRMNWEDVLGGKDGLSGLKVTMSPPTGDGKNQQIRIGMGGQGQPDDGSTPLKIVSFQPIENYPGQMTSGSGGGGATGGGGGMPSIGNPVMLQNQSTGSTYMQQPRPLVGGGVPRTQSTPAAFTYAQMPNGGRLPGAPLMSMGNFNNARGNRPVTRNCGNRNCTVCQSQSQQAYSAPRRR